MRYTTPVARLMKRVKLTSAEVEAICSVSRQTVHNWRTGANEPQIHNVSLLMSALNKRGIETTLADFVPPTRK